MFKAPILGEDHGMIRTIFTDHSRVKCTPRPELFPNKNKEQGVSRITDDFENNEMSAEDVLFDCYPSSVVNKLLSHARALEAMLERVQFCHGDSAEWCYICGSRINIHSTDCELARLIE